MRAARLAGPKHFEFIDVEVPTPSDGECLIKLERASVCGSDIRNAFNVLSEEDYPMPPGRPCHEAAGVVVESRTDGFREGQRVIVLPEKGHGGLTEYLVSAPRMMVPLPDEGPLEEWVMCQPSGTVLYSCQQMPNILGKNVVVLGQGSIGLSFTMITSRCGANKVIGVDPLEFRLSKSKEFGATHVVNPDKVDVDEAVADLTGGEGADIVVEAAGYPETFDTVFRLVRQYGTVIIFGVQTDDRVLVTHDTLMDKQARIIPTTGARSGNPTAHIKKIVDLRQRGWCDPGKLITHRMGLSQVQAAFEMYEAHADNIIKVVMNVNE